MPYTFRIVFSGLCAFVADRRFDDEKNPPTRGTVLLRDLQDGLTLSNGQVVPHFAFVEADPSFVRSASTRTTEAVGAIVRSPLAKEDLEIVLPLGAQSSGMVVEAAQPQDIVNPAGDDRKSLFFLPTVDQVNNQAVSVKSALLDPLPPAQPPLAGRVALTEGTLSTFRLQNGTWALAAVGTDVSQAALTGRRLADSIALEISGLTGDIELRFTPFGSATATTLILGPTPAAPAPSSHGAPLHEGEKVVTGARLKLFSDGHFFERNFSPCP